MTSMYRSIHSVLLVDDGKPPVRPDERRNQAPDRHAVRSPTHIRRHPILAVYLPHDRAPLVPAHAFGPREEHFVFRVDRDRGVLAALGDSRGADRRGALAGLGVDAREIDLIFGFPGSDHQAVRTFSEGFGTHRARADRPRMDVLALEFLSPVERG